MIGIIVDTLKKYFFLVHFSLITLCAFFAAKIVGGMIAYRLGSISVEEERVSPPRDYSASRPSPRSSIRQYSVIVDRNIFNSQASALESIGQTDIPEDLPPTPLQATLLGTVIGPEGYSFAVIEDKTAKETGIYRVNDMIQDQAKVIQIERNRVVVYREGRQESLLLFDKENSPTIATTTSTSSRAGEDLEVREVSEGEYEISREEFEDATNNLGTLLTQARVVPNLVDGEVTGYKIFAIKRGSLYEKIGLKNGDIIENINGIDISSPEKALQLFQDLRNESRFVVELTRRGKPMSLNYSVR